MMPMQNNLAQRMAMARPPQAPGMIPGGNMPGRMPMQPGAVPVRAVGMPGAPAPAAAAPPMVPGGGPAPLMPGGPASPAMPMQPGGGPPQFMPQPQMQTQAQQNQMLPTQPQNVMRARMGMI